MPYGQQSGREFCRPWLGNWMDELEPLHWEIHWVMSTLRFDGMIS